MLARKALLVISWISLVGCATAPCPEADYLETADALHASAHIDLGVSQTLPEEPELNGPHPVAYYLQIALERNPEILAARRAVTAQAYEIPQVTSLENPMVTNTFWPIPEHSPQTASGRMPYSLMATQQFPWLGKLRVQGEVAEQETKIALTQLAQAQLEVMESVQLVYYDVYYYQKAISITEENEKLLEDFIRFAEIRFRTGGSQQDVLRAQLEQDRLREQLIGFRRQLRMAQADLVALLHASPDLEPLAMKDLDLPEAPEAIEHIYELAVRCRPELQAKLHTIVRDQRSRELAALDYYPDFTAGMSWDLMTRDQALAPSADGRDNIGFIVGVSVPLWRDRLRAGVREAENRVVESARRYDAARDDTYRQIRRLIAQADAAQQQIDLFGEAILPRTEQTLDVSIADYRVGKVDFLQVIDNYSELLTFQIQLARLQTNLAQAMASLERIVGCQLAMFPETAESSDSKTEAPAPAPAEERNTAPNDDSQAAIGDSFDLPRQASLAPIERSEQHAMPSCRPASGRSQPISISASEPQESMPEDTPEESENEIQAKEGPRFEPFCPVLGTGYLPYDYPGFDVCPCAGDSCFHPANYCDPCYREFWFRKWLRAHWGPGSMLEDVPCLCISPTTGRPLLLQNPTPEPVPEESPPPASQNADPPGESP